MDRRSLDLALAAPPAACGTPPALARARRWAAVKGVLGGVWAEVEADFCGLEGEGAGDTALRLPSPPRLAALPRGDDAGLLA